MFIFIEFLVSNFFFLKKHVLFELLYDNIIKVCGTFLITIVTLLCKTVFYQFYIIHDYVSFYLLSTTN